MNSTRYRPWNLLKLFCFLCIAFQSSRADVPVGHNGHVSLDGTPYSGVGFFKFSIVDQNKTILWNHDGSNTNVPSGTLQLEVNNGFYSLFLGDSSRLGMSPLPASTLRATNLAYLKIWFGQDEDGSFEQIGTDLALGATPFSLVSEISRGSPEIENKLTLLNNRVNALEKIIANIPPSAIDPILLAEVGYTKFTSRELTGLSLPGVDLTKALFDNARIISANLISSTLDDALLNKAFIKDSNFSNASMRLADFSRSELYNTELKKVIATGSTFSRAEGNSSNFSQAQLDLVDFNRAVFVDSNFTQANLNNSIMGKASFSNCIFEDAKLTSVDATEASFSDSNFTNATLSGNFTDTNFQKCDMKNAQFSGADLTNANLTGSLNFDPASYIGVIYANTIMPDGTARTD